MKPIAPKIHLAYFSDPLTSYRDLTVRCGAVLKHADPKWMFEEGLEDGVRWMELERRSCRKCVLGLTGEPLRYLYGLVNAQEEIGVEG